MTPRRKGAAVHEESSMSRHENRTRTTARRKVPRYTRRAAPAAVLFVVLAACGSSGGRGVDTEALLQATPSTLAGTGGATAGSESSTDGTGPAGLVPSAGDQRGADGPTAAGAPASGQDGSPTAGVAMVPSQHPGVTATEVRIGVAIVDDGAAVYAAAGADLATASADQQEAEITAIADDINHRGGTAGRKLVPVFYRFSYSSGTFAAQAQAICTHFTDDVNVLAVVTWNSTSELPACLAQHDTAHVDIGNSEAYDERELRRFGPSYYRPMQLHLDRLRPFVDRLVTRGFLTRANKIGILRYDKGQYARTSENVIRPAMAAYGLSVAAEFAFTPVGSLGDLSNTAAQANNAVLRFRSAGVDRVVLIASQAAIPFFFMPAAESQGYHPEYGVTSLDAPASLPGNMPEAQLERTVGIGWNVVYDVDFGWSRSSHIPDFKRCADLLRSIAESRGFACDPYWFIDAALDGAPEVSPAGMRAGVDGLGGSLHLAATFGLQYAPGRIEGIARARDVIFDSTCGCFAYTGPDWPLP